jgi:hypothetical protein
VTTRTCWHPHCHRELQRGRSVCPPHWHALDDELRARLKADEHDEQLRLDIDQYFRSRLIGDHEIVYCRHRDCGADIVFLVTKGGKNIPVNADTVWAEDDQFVYGRHVAHFTSCPGAEGFRR